MKTIDWTKANALIDSYLAHLTNPNELPGKLGRTWMEFEAERVGMIQDGRGWKLGESHAMWYAALIRTGRLYEVNKVEKQILHRNKTGKIITTLATVRKLLNGRMRDTVAAIYLRDMISA